jgi:subtilase family serine protease
LIVSSLSVPGSAAAGSLLAISTTTKNQGTGIADPSTTRFYISTNSVVDAGDARLAEVHAVPSLAPGASESVSLSVGIPSKLAAGVYYLIAKADADDVVFENQEANNTAARTVSVGPDLIMSAFTVPGVGAAGARVVASYSVRNQGTSQAGASTLRFFWSVNYSLDASDTLLASADVAAIEAAGSASGEATLTIPAEAVTGTYYVIAEADSLKSVLESSETNNGAARSVRIGGDLVVMTFDAPAAGGAGVPLSLGDTTKNTGAGAIAASATHFYLSTDAMLSASDPLLGTRAINALAANESSVGTTLVTLPVGTAAGSYYLYAKTDGGNLVSETQEGNNTAVRSFSVGPDLIVSISSVTWPIPAGTAALVKDTATNRGGAEAGSSVVTYHLSTNYTLDASDQQLAERSIDPLAPGAMSTATTSMIVPAGTPPGYYYVIAKADGGGAVVESSETNNIWGQLIRVN